MTITDTPHMQTADPEKLLNPVEDAVLTEFAQIMVEWGHYKTAAKLRFPTQAEVCDALERFDRWCK